MYCYTGNRLPYTVLCAPPAISKSLELLKAMDRGFGVLWIEVKAMAKGKSAKERRLDEMAKDYRQFEVNERRCSLGTMGSE